MFKIGSTYVWVPFVGNAVAPEGWRTLEGFRQVAAGMQHPTY